MISVVIPAYNEEKGIVKSVNRIIEYFSSINEDFEILVVSDGSSDNTVGVVSALGHEKVKVIDYGDNKGKGFAVRSGMLKAKGDIILFSDADLSTPIEEIEKFMPYFEQGYDVVIGSRAIVGSDIKVHQPFYREWLGKVFNFFVQMFAIKGISDTQCGFKAFTHQAAKKVFSLQELDGFSFDVEALYLASKLGYKIKELPVVWVNDEASKVNPIVDSYKMFKDIIKIRKMHKRTFS